VPSGVDGTLRAMNSGDSRPDVDQYRRSITLGKNSDVAYGSDDAGHATVNGVPTDGYASLVAAAALPAPTARVCEVTGNTNITSIVTNGVAGQRVTLIFRGTPTFTDGGNLKLSANLVATADDTITLVSDGTAWYETARSVN
jgi:hypothetical protein